MKKLTILILMVFGYFSNANAIEGVNFGVSLAAGVFDVDGAKEEFKGSHAGAAGTGDIEKKASDHGDTAEGLFAIGSIFVEKELSDVVSVGFDYSPIPQESESALNQQSDITTSTTATTQDNTVQVDFEDLTTIYLMVRAPVGLYAKAGVVKVDVVTNESLGTGGAYGNTDLDGSMFAIGLDRDIMNDMFVRLEANWMDLDGATLENVNDSNKTVTVDGISGYGAKLSVGKSF